MHPFLQRGSLVAVLVVGVLAACVSASHRLNEAVVGNQYDTIKSLIDAGEDINHIPEDEQGVSALYLAAMLGRNDMVKTLMSEYGADPTVGDNRGYSAMDLGASSNSYNNSCNECISI